MSDEELLTVEGMIAELIAENRHLRAENKRLHERLKAQIAQNGQLIRQGRKLDGERTQYRVAVIQDERIGNKKEWRHE